MEKAMETIILGEGLLLDMILQNKNMEHIKLL